MSAPPDIAAIIAQARTAADALALNLLERGGDREAVRAGVARIFAALYQLARLDAAFTDRRRRESLRLAGLVVPAYRAGVTVAQLAVRHRLSKRRIYGVIEEFGSDVSPFTPLCLTPADAESSGPVKLKEVKS